MKMNRITVLLALVMFAAGTAAVAAEATILERVRKVEDPQLAELIEIARENYPLISISRIREGAEINRIEYENTIGLHQAIRTVTEKYAQIRLLDNKIEELEKKIASSKSTQDVQSERVVAKASLEAERLSCIAALREAMHLVPWTPFGDKDVRELDTYINLQVLGDNAIRIINYKKPFSSQWPNLRAEAFSFKTPAETVEYIEDIIKNEEALPIRLTFSATESWDTAVQHLQEELKAMIREQEKEYETDLRSGIMRLQEQTVTISYFGDGKLIEHPRTNIAHPIDTYVHSLRASLLQPYNSIPLTIKILSFGEKHEDEHAQFMAGLKQMVEELGVEEYVRIVEPEEVEGS